MVIDNELKEIFCGDSSEKDKYDMSAESNTILCVTCCDSRVRPFLLFGENTHKVFMIRNIAGIIEKYNTNNETISAIEFSINAFQIKHAVVITHTCCAGMENAMLNKKHAIDSVNNYLDKIHGIDSKLSETNDFDTYQRLIMKNSLENLEYIISKNNKNHIKIIGCVVDIADGDVKKFNREKEIFE